MNIKQQTSKDEFWTDSGGIRIPFKRVNAVERLQEKTAAKLLKGALDINKRLLEFKILSQDLCSEVYAEFMKAKNNDTATAKGNYSWFNFDRSIKVEIAIKDRIDFDDLGVISCKEKLNQFLKENVQSEHDFIKEIVTSAFETTKGKLDVKKALDLLRYKEKVKEPLFLSAMDDLEAAIRRPDSKSYFRIYTQEADGSYKMIDLNFSSVK